MLEGMKKAEDFKVQLQLLTATLAQKEEHIDTLCRERSQKDVSFPGWGTDVCDVLYGSLRYTSAIRKPLHPLAQKRCSRFP
jgi:hypothetical protein